MQKISSSNLLSWVGVFISIDLLCGISNILIVLLILKLLLIILYVLILLFSFDRVFPIGWLT